MEAKNKALKSGQRGIGYLIVLAILLTFLSGCSNDNPLQPAASNGNVSFSSSSSNSFPGVNNQNLLQITEAKVLIKNMKIYPVNEEENEEHCKIIMTGPFVINLNVGSKTTTLTNINLPPGNYKMVKYEIHKVSPDEIPPDPEFTDLHGRFSVVVKGNFNGTGFIYKSMISANQKDNLQRTLAISANSNYNITFFAIPLLWFIDDTGNVLDPNIELNRHIIDDNIRDNLKNHIKLFIDNDHDGNPD